MGTLSDEGHGEVWGSEQLHSCLGWKGSLWSEGCVKKGRVEGRDDVAAHP